MIKVLVQYIFRFVILVLIQVLIFNNIQLSGYINPYIYVLFILLLPFETPGWLLLILGFLLGIAIDLFSDTMGMHTVSTTLMAFMRPFVLNIIAPRDGYETGSNPRISHYGFAWFFKYAAILVTIHHFILFYIEIFQFGGFFSTLLRVILSSAVTLFIIILSQYFVYRQ